MSEKLVRMMVAERMKTNKNLNSQMRAKLREVEVDCATGSLPKLLKSQMAI